MFGRPGPHQFRRRALFDPSRRLERVRRGGGAICPFSLSAFPKGTSALAASLPGFCSRRCQRRAAFRLDRRQLCAGKTADLARDPPAGGQSCRDFHGTPRQPEPVVKLDIAPGIILWREKFSRSAQELLLQDILAREKQAPFYRPVMPG